MLHTWKPPPPPPPRLVVAGRTALSLVLPPLLLLLLFLLRANRAPAAWWLWLPLGVAALVGFSLVGLLADGDAFLLRTVYGLAVGLGAVWLLMPWLQSRYRAFGFVKTLAVLVAFSVMACVANVATGGASWGEFWPYLAILLGCAGLIVALALTLAGFCVRRRFGRWRFLLWLTAWVLLGWAATVPPLVLAISAAVGQGPDWTEAVLGMLVISLLTIGVLLPLVLLSFFQPFYRTRFRAWLNLPQPETPPNAAAPPPLDPAGASLLSVE